ncbi:MAG: 2'-deoxycytidine 5'-triphosphate deaminase [Nanoarchaeota archaeon]|nr:2'-deoxycytidine 5'-triphosphate deaminase [Nanoarchaeota archaeon]
MVTLVKSDIILSEVFASRPRQTIIVHHGLVPEFRRNRGDSGISQALPCLDERNFPSFDGCKEGVEGELKEQGLTISPFNIEQLQSAGLDFLVGNEIYSSDVLFKVNSFHDLKKLRRFELKDGESFNLEADDFGRRVYYILSKERMKLPDNLELVVDSKSTTGRLGCMCHNVANNTLIRQSQNPIVVAVRPYAFPITIAAGKSKLFSGIIRYRQSPFMNHDEIKEHRSEIKFTREGSEVDIEDLITADGLGLHFSTRKVYAAKNLASIPGPVNIDGVNCYNPEDYFEEVLGDREVVMDPRRLYLFGTLEAVSLGNVCGRLTREHAELLSGLWSHFAGFFWPGFSGEITMECWSDTKRLIRERELAGVVAFDKLTTQDGKSVEGYQGNYQGQKAPRLPKMFKLG